MWELVFRWPTLFSKATVFCLPRAGAEVTWTWGPSGLPRKWPEITRIYINKATQINSGADCRDDIIHQQRRRRFFLFVYVCQTRLERSTTVGVGVAWPCRDGYCYRYRGAVLVTTAVQDQGDFMTNFFHRCCPKVQQEGYRRPHFCLWSNNPVSAGISRLTGW